MEELKSCVDHLVETNFRVVDMGDTAEELRKTREWWTAATPHVPDRHRQAIQAFVGYDGRVPSLRYGRAAMVLWLQFIGEKAAAREALRAKSSPRPSASPAAPPGSPPIWSTRSSGS
jgi:hypothetical protein